MFPGGWASPLLLLALLPGWLFLQWRSAHQGAPPRTGLDQFFEVLSVGLITTGASALIWIICSTSFRISWVLDAQRTFLDGSGYVEQRIAAAAWTTAIVMTGAVLLAYALHRLVHRRNPATFTREPVWVATLGRREGDVPWVGLKLRDGRLVEGILYSYPTGEQRECRDIALQRPIRVTADVVGASAVMTELTRVIINERDIQSISLILTEPPTE